MLSFTIWLVVSLVAVYIYANSDDEMAYLCATISVMSIITSLVLAPWQIKLLLLVMLLMSQQRRWSKKSIAPSQSNPEPKAEEKDRDLVVTANRPTFELKYRGVAIKS